MSSALDTGLASPADVSRARRDLDLLREHGKVRCRVCERVGPADQAFVMMLGMLPVYAICRACAGDHEVRVEPSPTGIFVHHVKTRPYQLASVP
jgi:hypothetical protein